MTKRAMIDIETLSLRPNAAIRSIGAVVLVTNETDDLHYYGVINDELFKATFHRDPDTLAWWNEQEAAAKNAFTNPSNPETVLASFAAFLKENEPDEIWANGAQFDTVILENAFRAFGIDVPWKYNQVRDFRTLRALVQVDYTRPESRIKHHALDDAINQTAELRMILAKIGIQ